MKPGAGGGWWQRFPSLWAALCSTRSSAARRDVSPFGRDAASLSQGHQVSQREGTARDARGRCVREQPSAPLVFTTQARSLAGHCREHKHPAPPLPAQASAKGAGFYSQMNVKLSDLSLPRVQASPPCVQAAPPLHLSKGHLGSTAIVLEPKASLCFFFSPRYSQAGFYLSTVCPQTYHFKWVRLLIDMNGAILDMKALLYLVSLVTAGASWSTDGVYLSCAKSVYWRN